MNPLASSNACTKNLLDLHTAIRLRTLSLAHRSFWTETNSAGNLRFSCRNQFRFSFRSFIVARCRKGENDNGVGEPVDAPALRALSADIESERLGGWMLGWDAAIAGDEFAAENAEVMPAATVPVHERPESFQDWHEKMMEGGGGSDPAGMWSAVNREAGHFLDVGEDLGKRFADAFIELLEVEDEDRMIFAHPDAQERTDLGRDVLHVERSDADLK